jgi:NAD+ synthase
MGKFDEVLEIDAEKASSQISSFIEEKRIQLNRDGVILGYSGGLDSTVAAYLTAKGVGRERITLLNLPDQDSKAQHRKDAEDIAALLNVKFQVIDITPIISELGVYDLIPFDKLLDERFVKAMEAYSKKSRESKVSKVNGNQNFIADRFNVRPNSLAAKINAYGAAKHRIRMVMLYHQANIHNLMVVGAANRTELMTGTFIQWGCDHNADVMPFIHLYRTQLEKLAEHLEIPARIRSKPADPDITPISSDKGEWLGTFEKADFILWGLENGVSEEILAEEFGSDSVTHIKSLFERSKFMRECPYTLP